MNPLAALRHMAHGPQFRAFGLHAPELTNPFLGVDHAWMSGPTFPPHPHAGFSAVSYLFTDSETGIANRDSLGGRQAILPGGLHWTAAGRGVVHEEHPAEPGKTVHMLQIFVNLPAERQADAPAVLALAPQQVPVVSLPGAQLRVPLGHFGDVRSPLRPPTPVQLLDISLQPGARLDLPVAAGHSAFVLPIRGRVQVDGAAWQAPADAVPVRLATPAAGTLRLVADEDGAQLVLFAGRPLQQAVHGQGPFAMASAEALQGAVQAWQRGAFGSL